MKRQIDLDSWKIPVKTQSYLLGQSVNLQVSAPHLLADEKLYLNSCYAAPSKSSLKYTIIDNYGYVDSRMFKKYEYSWICLWLPFCPSYPQLYAGQQAGTRGLPLHFSDRQNPEILLKGLPVYSRPRH